MPLHRSMGAVCEARPVRSAPPRRGSADRTMPLASCEQPRDAVPSTTIPCQLVAGVSRRSAAPGSQFVEWSARGRAQLQTLALQAGPSSPNPNAGRSSRKAGSSRWPGRAVCLRWQFRLVPVVGRVAVESPRPNQSVKGTAHGGPPLVRLAQAVPPWSAPYLQR